MSGPFRHSPFDQDIRNGANCFFPVLFRHGITDRLQDLHRHISYFPNEGYG